MWRRITKFVQTLQGARLAGAGPPAVVFERYARLPNLFSFNHEKLDINLLILPESGANADRDAVLLLVYGCGEILGLEEVNEAYLCRKIGETWNRARAVGSFEDVFAATASESAPDKVRACLDKGLLERVTVEAGGSVRLARRARGYVEDMAYDLDRRGSR